MRLHGLPRPSARFELGVVEGDADVASNNHVHDRLFEGIVAFDAQWIPVAVRGDTQSFSEHGMRNAALHSQLMAVVAYPS